MKKDLWTALMMTVATTLLFGLVYPLAVTAIAQLTMRDKANGQLIVENNVVRGSRLIGQSFVGDRYFHSRPSAAGAGYDATASGGSNLGPTNSALIARISDAAKSEAAANQRTDAPPVELVTTSASGLDPEISPAAAEYQLARVARVRGLSAEQLRAIVARHTTSRQFGLLGEARVNVLELNLELDHMR